MPLSWLLTVLASAITRTTKKRRLSFRRADPTERTVRLSGSDPLNLTGVVLRGERVPARTTEWFDLPI